MSSDLFATPEHTLFRETARRFVEQELRPRAREFDALGMLDKSLYKRMGDLGMLGLRYDPEWGGSGLDWSFTTVLFEELGRSDTAGVTMGISVQTDMATPSLHQFGSDELKLAYLAPAIAGEMVAAIAVTDPGAGYGGFSQIVVPTQSPGFRYELLDKIGNWGSDTGQLFFEDVRVPVANTIGEIGRGFQQQMMQFQDERLVACVSSIAGAQDLWEQTRSWAEQRVLFGKPLSKMQVSQFKFVEMLTRITAARELIYACTRQRVAGVDATELITMAKLFCSRVSRFVADECIQLHGGYGYMKESAAGRAFVDSRLASIGGGSDETMMHYLAKQLGF
jgi:citronellyl-CoA dehydrogenase